MGGIRKGSREGCEKEEPEGEDLAEEERSDNHLHNKLTSLPQLVLIQILMSPYNNVIISLITTNN